jgi:hypothetical protein
MRASGIILILLALTLPASGQQGLGDSASGPATISRLQTGDILSVEKHGEGRAFDWVSGGLALIPVYDHYAFYNITVRLSGKNYVVRYETQTGYYPAAWKPGNPIQVRPGHGRLYLLRYDGVEVPASIVHESSVRH